jgi:hypothetical protein
MPTDAFATTAPEGSVTCPRSVPVVTGAVVAGEVVAGDEELEADDCGCGDAAAGNGELIRNTEISRARNVVKSRADLSVENSAEILIPAMACDRCFKLTPCTFQAARLMGIDY